MSDDKKDAETLRLIEEYKLAVFMLADLWLVEKGAFYGRSADLREAVAIAVEQINRAAP